IELIDHRIDRALQLQYLSARVGRDLARQVSVCDCGGDVGDISYLPRQVTGHRVYAVGEVLARCGGTADIGLAAQGAIGAYFAGDARNFRGEGVELIDHRVDRILQLQDFAFGVRGNLLGKVAVCDGGRDRGDISHLAGEVAGHEVDAVG